MNLFKAVAFLLAVAAVIAAFAVYPMLPASVPTHWNANGIADGYGPRWMGAFLFPVIMLLVLLLFVVIPKIAVFKENFKAFEREYWVLALLLQAWFLVFFALTLMPNFGIEFNMSSPIVLLVALLFIVLGLLMPRFKRNFFVGIRTPWTLANDTVWEKTHRLGGKLFIVAGIVSLVAAVLPGSLAVWASVGTVLVVTALTLLYSFLEFRKLGGKKNL